MKGKKVKNKKRDRRLFSATASRGKSINVLRPKNSIGGIRF